MSTSVFEKYYKFCPNCKTELKRKSIDGRPRIFCPNCNFIFWNNPKPVVSIVLQDGRKVLLLKRANRPLKDYWCLPGGFINYDETPQEAIEREVKEELEAGITISKTLGVYRIDHDPRGVHLDIIYEGKIKGNIHLSEEHNKYGYFQPDKLPQKVAYKHREAIGDWYKSQLR